MIKKSLHKQFNRKLVVAGNVLECYTYETPIIKGIEKKRTGRANSPNTTEDEKQINRGKIANRAKSTVRRYANANPDLKKFLTLTFAENITDLDIARYEFDKFIKRLKTLHKKLKYICVVEFQKRGAVHFHVLCNLPYIEVNALAKVWKQGFVKLNRIDNVDNVGAYITKYMTKDNIDERLAGRKCYTMSKNLNEPKSYTEETKIDEILENVEGVKRVYTTEFESEYYGRIVYTQIVCDKQIKLPSSFQKLLDKFKGRLIPCPDETPCPF